MNKLWLSIVSIRSLSIALQFKKTMSWVERVWGWYLVYLPLQEIDEACWRFNDGGLCHQVVHIISRVDGVFIKVRHCLCSCYLHVDCFWQLSHHTFITDTNAFVWISALSLCMWICVCLLWWNCPDYSSVHTWQPRASWVIGSQVDTWDALLFTPGIINTFLLTACDQTRKAVPRVFSLYLVYLYGLFQML